MSADIARAVEFLTAGSLVAFPTETVYGLGADASNPKALEKLYQAKGRPASHPVIVHICDISELSRWAVNIPDQAFLLAEKFWPGPMTLILPKAKNVPLEVTGGQDSVGIRIPSHPLALELLRAFKGGLAAPSANKFGQLSPTTAQAVAGQFGRAEVAMVLDGGPCSVGIESTIISLLAQPKILRPGMISRSEIEEILALENSINASSDPRVPGALPSHYAPQTKLTVAPGNVLIDLVLELNAMEHAAAVFAFEPTVEKLSKGLSGLAFDAVVTAPTSVGEYARQLYDQLRRFDSLKVDRIFVESVPQDSSWDGVRDRLERASANV